MRVVSVLALLLLASAFSLVTSASRARKAFIAIEQSHDEARRLDLAYSQLQVEQTAYGKHSLVEQTAREQLKMMPVTPDRTEYLTPEGVIKSGDGR
jgi:cell division protein FtsL